MTTIEKACITNWYCAIEEMIHFCSGEGLGENAINCILGLNVRTDFAASILTIVCVCVCLTTSPTLRKLNIKSLGYSFKMKHSVRSASMYACNNPSYFCSSAIINKHDITVFSIEKIKAADQLLSPKLR